MHAIERCGLPYDHYGDIRECRLPFNHEHDCAEANHRAFVDSLRELDRWVF